MLYEPDAVRAELANMPPPDDIPAPSMEAGDLADLPLRE